MSSVIVLRPVSGTSWHQASEARDPGTWSLSWQVGSQREKRQEEEQSESTREDHAAPAANALPVALWFVADAPARCSRPAGSTARPSPSESGPADTVFALAGFVLPQAPHPAPGTGPRCRPHSSVQNS